MAKSEGDSEVGAGMDDGSDSLSFVEGHFKEAGPDEVTVELYVCARCAVFKPSAEVTFTRRDAVMHLITMHPHKLADHLAGNPLMTLEIAFILDDGDRFKGGV